MEYDLISKYMRTMSKKTPARSRHIEPLEFVAMKSMFLKTFQLMNLGRTAGYAVTTN